MIECDIVSFYRMSSSQTQKDIHYFNHHYANKERREEHKSQEEFKKDVSAEIKKKNEDGNIQPSLKSEIKDLKEERKEIQKEQNEIAKEDAKNKKYEDKAQRRYEKKEKKEKEIQDHKEKEEAIKGTPTKKA